MPLVRVCGVFRPPPSKYQMRDKNAVSAVNLVFNSPSVSFAVLDILSGLCVARGKDLAKAEIDENTGKTVVAEGGGRGRAAEGKALYKIPGGQQQPGEERGRFLLQDLSFFFSCDQKKSPTSWCSNSDRVSVRGTLVAASPIAAASD